jgi:branched-chain amino acid transport system substrate-binding protein
MAPFDNPALAAANIRIKQINAKGGVDGRKFVIKTCDTQNNNAARAKSCALSLLGGGANIVFVTCDVDFATPVVQETIKRGKLAIAPCIGTDQMGPKRFSKQGKLAFSFGNVAQDEGSAMAQYAIKRGWKTAGLATNTLLVYFKNVVQAFDKRFRQLGGKVVDRESYATGANNVNTAVSRLNSHKAAVYVTSTAFGELPAFVSGLRSLHNNTPILNSWAGDGTYWNTSNPKVTNYYFVTFASVFGDDPSKDVRKMIASLKAAGATPGTGGFLGGADAIDGVAIAIKRAHGSLKGSALAAQLEKFHQVPVLGGKISFSPKLHTVFGRQYRVIKIQNNKASYVGPVTAKVVPKLP